MTSDESCFTLYSYIFITVLVLIFYKHKEYPPTKNVTHVEFSYRNEWYNLTGSGLFRNS